MNERKERFTPGPWYVYDTRERAEHAYDYYITAGQYFVAAVSPNSLDIQDANAVLMSASPDMYEELEQTASFLRFVAKWIEGQHGIIAIGEALKYKAEIIDKLLEKARGEVQR